MMQLRHCESILTAGVLMFAALAAGAAAHAQPCDEPLPPCRADIAPPGKPDGMVNVNDLLLVINHWAQSGVPNGPRPPADCAPHPNGDCVVNVNDLLAVIRFWGECAPPFGACCFGHDVCQYLTQAQCESSQGLWLNVLACDQCPPVPDNNQCDWATPLVNGTHVINNQYATASAVPAPTCTDSITRDLWFTFTAPCSGTLTLDLCSTSGPVTDTVIAVYTGSCNDLTEIGCNDLGACQQTNLSMLTIQVAQCMPYLVRIGTRGGDPGNQGEMTLTVSCAASSNVTCNDGIMVPIGGLACGSMVNAPASDAPPCNGVNAMPGRWHWFFGDGTALTVSLCRSPSKQYWDARLSVYAGTCEVPVCVTAANVDSCGYFETVSFCSTRGVRYLILVHSSDIDSVMDYVLTVSGGAACSPESEALKP